MMMFITRFMKIQHLVQHTHTEMMIL